jgi:hypothetical protein
MVYSFSSIEATVSSEFANFLRIAYDIRYLKFSPSMIGATLF